MDTPGLTRPLPAPFIVVATQNPIEYEGTYPLPEAQLDRFLAKIDVDYPSAADESAILHLAHRGVTPATLDDVRAVTTPEELLAARATVDAIQVHDAIVDYVVALVRRTRELPSVLLAIDREGESADRTEAWLRSLDPPVIARIEHDRVVLDVRTVPPAQDTLLGDLLLSHP